MQYQWSNSEVAPRAGFEPATNRLTVASHRLCRIAARGLPAFIFLASTYQNPLWRRHFWHLAPDRY